MRGAMLADAAGRVIARLDGPSAQRHQARAFVWLETVRATEHAGLSRALTAGLEARLVAAAEAIAQAAEFWRRARSRKRRTVGAPGARSRARWRPSRKA